MCSSAFAQTEYSESKPFEPSGKSKLEGKKSRKGKPDDPKPVVSSGGADTILIPFSVVDKSRRFVRGLSKSDLKVFVDGDETAVTSLENTNEPVNVILFIDTSLSTKDRLDTIRDHAVAIVEDLPPNANVMVVEFNTILNVLSHLTNDRSETRKGIEKLKARDGGTSIYSAVQILFQKVIPYVPARRSVVMMTDGVDTTSKNASYATSLSEIEKTDVSVYSIYYDTLNDRARRLPSNIDRILQDALRSQGRLGRSEAEYETARAYLNDVTSASGGRSIEMKDLKSKNTAFGDEISQKYYASVSIQRKGVSGLRRQLKVRIARPNLIIRARGSSVEQD